MPTLFVDEVKGNRYRLVAVCVANGDIPRIRKLLRAEVLPGQRSIHFAKEQANRRKLFRSTCNRLEFVAYEIDVGRGTDFEARPKALSILVDLARHTESDRIVLDLDESLRVSDEHILKKELKVKYPEMKIGFDHVKRHEEPLL